MASHSRRTWAALFAGATAVAALGSAAADQPKPVAAPESATPVAPGPVVLEVHAIGFDSDRGQAVAKLYRPADNVLSQSSYARTASAIHSGEARLRFTDLPAGTYALVVFHDENGNGQIDHNLFHLPKEQLGFSNGFRPGLSAGLPTFEKLHFQLTRASGAGRVTMEIVVK